MAERDGPERRTTNSLSIALSPGRATLPSWKSRSDPLVLDRHLHDPAVELVNRHGVAAVVLHERTQLRSLDAECGILGHQYRLAPIVGEIQTGGEDPVVRCRRVEDVGEPIGVDPVELDAQRAAARKDHRDRATRQAGMPRAAPTAAAPSGRWRPPRRASSSSWSSSSTTTSGSTTPCSSNLSGALGSASNTHVSRTKERATESPEPIVRLGSPLEPPDPRIQLCLPSPSAVCRPLGRLPPSAFRLRSSVRTSWQISGSRSSSP